MLNTPEWTARLAPQTPHGLTKVRQLYLNIYDAITRGDLPFGQQLPSSRQLSQQLGIGRNTVIAVYRQLDDEGLTSSAGRLGTRVTHSAAQPVAKAHSASLKEQLSARSGSRHGHKSQYSMLTPGSPDSALFPKEAWRKALAVASRLPSRYLGYRTKPLPSLQSSVARYLSIYRSLNVDPEQIVITSGTRQSLLLAATLYADAGHRAWVESPGYPGAVDAFSQQGLDIAPLAVSSEGHHLEGLLNSTAASLIYLTPCFQFPMGVALNAQQRIAILRFAERSGSVIFEDDYDSEFRDDTEARPALASQLSGQLGAQFSATVLHAGTFSKLIFPAARIAWLVVPKAHVDIAYGCLRTLGGGHNTVAQAAIAELLDNGSVARHLQRARGIYAQRRHILVDALNASGRFGSLPDTGGSLSMVAPLRQALPASTLAKSLNQARLGVQALQDFQWDRSPERVDQSGDCGRGQTVNQTHALVLGLGNVSSLKIPEAVGRLLAALDV